MISSVASERGPMTCKKIDSYDADFYIEELVRAAESVLSPRGWCRDDIERHLKDRVGRSIRSFST